MGPGPLAREVTGRLEIPTIGLGAGRGCSGQVLVAHDVLGLSGRAPRFAKRYLDAEDLMTRAVAEYAEVIRRLAEAPPGSVAAVELNMVEAIGRALDVRRGPVLVVDDDPLARERLGRIVRETFQGSVGVLEAENGLQGLDILARERPGIVVLDLLMPEMDGFGFLEAFGREPSFRDIPVLVVTAKDLSDEERSELDRRVRGIFPKDFSSAEDLAAKIRTLVRNSGRPAPA
jgi:CheY-like chemotaxis protein